MRLIMRAGLASPGVTSDTSRNRPGYGNSGNLLFAASVHEYFSARGNTVAVDGYDPDFASADEINEKYDAFLLPLANAFRPQFEDQLRRYTRVIKQLGIPCVVVGVGAQAGLDLAELKGAPTDEAVRAFVSAVLDRSATIGVRGEFTRDYLRRLGFDAVDIIGCPSLYSTDRAARIRKPSAVPTPEDPIAINHAANVSAGISHFARNVLEIYPNCVLVAQEAAEDLRWTQIAASVQPAGGPARVRRFLDARDWIAFMETRTFSAGPRIHGSIAALLAGVPAVVFAHDSRTLELARFHDIPHVMADAVSGETSVAELYRSADFDRFNAGAAGRLERYRMFLVKNGLRNASVAPRDRAGIV